MKGSRGHVPTLVYHGSDSGEETNPYVAELISQTPLLRERYEPPAIWGTSGHIQTSVFSLRTDRPGLDLSSLTSKRYYVTLADDTRICYDVFPPNKDEDTNEEDITLAVCPGLANSSDSMYIRAFTLQASQQGYRVAVLNNLGVLDEVLTTPRIFNFGSTEEYGAMVKGVLSSHPNTTLIAVGFSLGGNMICKYFGEDPKNQQRFLCGISLCQGYDFNRMRASMDSWSKMKKFYAMQLTNKVRDTVLNNWHHLKDSLGVSNHHTEEKTTSTPKDNLRKRVKKSKLMSKLDELVTIKLTGHSSVEEYYSWASSRHYLDNISLPILFVNARDDPLFSKASLEHPIEKVKSHRQSLMVLSKHGGHLGFFTKTGSTSIDPYTWLERMLLQYVAAAVNIHRTCHNCVPRAITLPSNHDSRKAITYVPNTDSDQPTDANSNHLTEHHKYSMHEHSATTTAKTLRIPQQRETTL